MAFLHHVKPESNPLQECPKRKIRNCLFPDTELSACTQPLGGAPQHLLVGTTRLLSDRHGFARKLLKTLPGPVQTAAPQQPFLPVHGVRLLENSSLWETQGVMTKVKIPRTLLICLTDMLIHGARRYFLHCAELYQAAIHAKHIQVALSRVFSLLVH
jgi:hypothetical protein